MFLCAPSTLELPSTAADCRSSFRARAPESQACRLPYLIRTAYTGLTTCASPRFTWPSFRLPLSPFSPAIHRGGESSAAAPLPVLQARSGEHSMTEARPSFFYFLFLFFLNSRRAWQPTKQTWPRSPIFRNRVNDERGLRDGRCPG